MQVSNRANVFSNYDINRRKQAIQPKTVFSETLKTKVDNLKSTSVTKDEILRKFPSLSAEDLDNIIKNYNIENMNSSELYKLADELMDKNVIPSYSHDNDMELIAVFPRSLYDAMQSDNTSSIHGGSISVAPDYLYTVDKNNTVLTYHGYPEFGLKNIQYGIHLTQNAFRDYDSYYTDQERERALQIEESKKAFYDLADMIATYQKNN